MAVVAFNIGLDVELRLADSLHAVVALAAVAENFQVIYKADDGKPQWAVTGLAGIARRHMIGCFVGDIREVFVMTVHAVGRQALMKGPWLR